MTDLTIGQAQRMTAPAPFALLTSADKEGKTNIMAVSWWTYLSNHPVKIGSETRRFSAAVVRAEARIRHPSLA